MTELGLDDLRMVEEIKADLKDCRTFERHVPAHDAEGIAHLRSLGRRAGRELGWKVRTLVTDPSEHETVLVFVVVVGSNPLHEQLMTMRADKALRQAFESWNLGGSDG